MSAEAIPADKLAELVEHIRTAARKRKTGTVLLRLILHDGRIVRAAVVPDFEEAVARPGVKAPICFESEPGNGSDARCSGLPQNELDGKGSAAIS